MAEIDVEATPDGDGWRCEVTVREGSSHSRHQVTVRREDLHRLTGGRGTEVEDLVRASFEFLLQREPKEFIFGRFDLMVIARYFPEYEQEISGRLAR